MSKEMIKISFNDWQAIGAELYKTDPEEFMKQAEAAGLDKESAIPWLGIGAGLLGYEAVKGIGGWLSRQFRGSALPSFAGNFAAQEQAFKIMELLEQSPDLRQTVVGADKLHNRLQELKGTIVGLRKYVARISEQQNTKRDEEKASEQADKDREALQEQMSALTGTKEETPAPAAPAAPVTTV